MSVKHNLEQWIAQLDYDDTCDISDRQVSELIRNYAALEAKCAALAAESAGLKAAIETHKHGFVRCNCCGDELMCHTDDVCRALDETPATDSFLAEVRAQGLNAFIQHHSAELDAHIKNGGEQFDEKSVRIRDIIVSARLFREQIRKEAAQ